MDSPLSEPTSLCREALRRPAGPDRSAYLDGACRGDAALRAKVEELLAAHDQTLDHRPDNAAPVATADVAQTVATDLGVRRTESEAPATETQSPLETTDGSASVTVPSLGTATGKLASDGGLSTIAGTTQPAARAGGFVPGEVIAGRYTLRDILGEGGMGTVYRAEQTAPVKRQVALKLIKIGMDSRAVLARFDAERQALALMDHPNIARVFDGGTTSAGQPFFVMEYVQGDPITDYCDQKRLSVKARLELFVAVCQAVQHAHQKGIIHRDLKPSNVMVTEVDGRATPKVIDFGVAKATEFSLTDQSLADTGAIVGTPTYMSPEQADPTSMDIDTRTDVYALGVILYELLAGSTPLDAARLKRGALLEMLRMVREVEPSRPSTKVSTADDLPDIAASRSVDPAQLKRALAGDLDWIVMKALEKDRARRYETANGFAADILRHLSNEPVLAAPPSRAYRMRKFVRKNRLAVTAAGLVAFTLLAGIAGTTVGFIRADLQRRSAEKAERAERLAKIEAVAQRAKAERATDRTREVLDAMVSEVTGDSLSTQKTISEEQKKFLTQVLSYYKEFAGEKTDDETTRARSANAAYRVGLIEDRLGRIEQAIVAFRMARDGYQGLAADFPAVPSYRMELAKNHTSLGHALEVVGNTVEAQEQYRSALAIQERLTADLPAAPEYRQDLVITHNNLGGLLSSTGKTAEAEEKFRAGLTIAEKLAADFPAPPEYRQNLVITHNNLGYLMARTGKTAEAEEKFRAGLTIAEKLAADFPAVSEYRRLWARSHAALGGLLAKVGKMAEAEAEYRRALTIHERLAADFPAVPELRQELADSHGNLSNMLDDMRRPAEAEQELRRALTIQEGLAADFPAIPAYRQSLASSHYNVAFLLANVGKSAEAEEQYRRALAIQEKLAADLPTIPGYRRTLAMDCNTLGIVLAGQGKSVEAEEQYRRALTIQEKLAADFPAIPVYRQDVASACSNLGIVLARQGKPVEAEGQYRRALTIQEELAADFPADADYLRACGGTLCNLGIMITDLGKPSQGVPYFQKAIDMLGPLHTDAPLNVITRQFLRNSHLGRAKAYRLLKKYPEAILDFDRVIALSDQSDQPSLKATRATTRLQAGQVAEAVAEVAELTRSPSEIPPEWYNLACFYALASDKVADKKVEFADRAMQLLQRAVKVGFNDAELMKRDSDLVSLRDRDDFRKLLADLEKRAQPKK
jgi:tetratricopeptide (TPR) repeat protein